MYWKHNYSKVLFFLNFIVIFNNSLAHYINKENINDIQINNNSPKRIPILFKKEVNIIIKESNNCIKNEDCDNGYICLNKKCNIDYTDKKCEMKSKNNKCPEPFICIKNVCQINDNAKFISNIGNGNNFILTEKGLIFIICFIVFLIIVFFSVLHFASKYKIDIDKVNKQQEQINSNISYPPNMLNPSEERNAYIRSLKEKESKLTSQNDVDTYIKNDDILNQFKLNDPYTTINSKKDYDIAGNIYPKTPQSGSTLINKSYSSTNNLINKNRLSERSSIHNPNYRKFSTGAISAMKDPSFYSSSIQDFNTSNSFSYIYPSENKIYNQQYNSYNSSPASPRAVHHQSLSLTIPRKLSTFESPILHGHTTYLHEGIPSTSNHIPYILEDDEEDDDQQTTLSFDSGVLKVASSSFKKNKESIIYSYSEDFNASKECIIPSPDTPTLNKKYIDN
ncbi:hypothetical protein BCR36DRAFT_341461 [Piromyces finnis]|uniref:EB domain-containing protein n=1 Tax=Piromyces finnis TaxID=1754191 RepID=A0A1Y1VP19_9FUNG|nr:hypothetical protein BCR36DRAFT_341461 [Piromyces finnis]|eukprot:ORX61144.1 hypothetical protein BCR36DRAFT_341461 [Piromyces finnis]